MSSPGHLTINGKPTAVAVDDPATPLLYILRNDLGLHGPKFGCGLGQCGACTVHVNGRALRSCTLPMSALKDTDRITTIEGLSADGHPHPLQQAFTAEQAVQCGYCINGMIMQAAELLERNKAPTDTDIRNALANNLCRCGTHMRIVRAIKRAAQA